MLLAYGVKCFDLWNEGSHRAEGNYKVDTEWILTSTQHWYSAIHILVSFLLSLSLSPPFPLSPCIGFILRQPCSLNWPVWPPAAPHPPSSATPVEGASPPSLGVPFLEETFIGPAWIPGSSLKQSLWPGGWELWWVSFSHPWRLVAGVGSQEQSPWLIALPRPKSAGARVPPNTPPKGEAGAC